MAYAGQQMMVCMVPVYQAGDPNQVQNGAWAPMGAVQMVSGMQMAGYGAWGGMAQNQWNGYGQWQEEGKKEGSGSPHTFNPAVKEFVPQFKETQDDTNSQEASKAKTSLQDMPSFESPTWEGDSGWSSTIRALNLEPKLAHG